VKIRFFDAAEGGEAFAPPTESAVEVKDGYFSVDVDIDTMVWAKRPATPWLELTVDNTTYTRQALSSVPFALFASTAERLSPACSGCVEDSQIASVSASKLDGVLAKDKGGTGVSEVEGWHLAELLTWANYKSGYCLVSYYKDPFGEVRLRGLIQFMKGAKETMFRLPEGYRPADRQLFGTIGYVPTNISGAIAMRYASCRVDVTNIGEVLLVDECMAFMSQAPVDSRPWITLSGISFRAEP
jgi:hypothetical protein